MLFFVGLGLFDLDDISLKGMQAIHHADLVVLEGYTSRLMGTSLREMEERYQKKIRLLTREDVEQHPESFIDEAKDRNVVFLTGGDPMISTTHMDLRIRAETAGIQTRMIHGSSIVSAACGLSGLQNYRFGKSCSVPYPTKNWFPETPLETITANLGQHLHTLVYLDIQPDRYMTVQEAISILEELCRRKGVIIPLYVGIARAGSPDPVVKAGSAGMLLSTPFGPPLHILIVPADLHPVEEEYLSLFAGYES